MERVGDKRTLVLLSFIYIYLLQHMFLTRRKNHTLMRFTFLGKIVLITTFYIVIRRVFMALMRIVKALKRHVSCKRNPNQYAKNLGVTLGDNVRFYNPNVGMFSTEPWLIKIGNNVHITDDVQFLTHDGGTLIIKDQIGDFVLTGNINIGDNVYIGIRTVIMPGVTIGDNCIVGACSVVTKDIPSNSLAVGVPARVIKSVDDYTAQVKGVLAGDSSRYYSDLDYMHALKSVE